MDHERQMRRLQKYFYTWTMDCGHHVRKYEISRIKTQCQFQKSKSTVKQMPREIPKKRVKTDTTSNEDGGNATVPATETTTATETTDVVSLTPMVMSGMEMIRLSLSVIYDITFISSYEVNELI